MAKAKKEPICEPINQCIYCDTIDVKYTDEHVIPAGLDGTWTIPKASCEECQKITSKFERQVLRGFLHEPRIAMESFTRRPQDRPNTLPLTINNKEYDVPVKEHSINLSLVDFIVPIWEG